MLIEAVVAVANDGTSECWMNLLLKQMVPLLAASCAAVGCAAVCCGGKAATALWLALLPPPLLGCRLYAYADYYNVVCA